MPPRTLESFASDAPVVLAPDCMLRMPNLAVQIARCIAVWASIEAAFAPLLARLLKAEALAVLDMALTLRGYSGQKAAIESASAHTLTGDLADLLQAILEVVDSAQKVRNPMAHHIWGFSEQAPDALLLVHPRYQATWSTHVQRSFDGITPPSTDLLRSEIMVWSECDLIEAAGQLEDAEYAITRFIHLLSASPGREGFFVELWNKASIQTALRRIKMPQVQKRGRPLSKAEEAVIQKLLVTPTVPPPPP